MDTSLFRKVDRVAVPLVPGLYKIHSIMWTLSGLAQDCPAPLVDSPVGHYTNTGTHSSIAAGYSFLLSYSKGELWNSAFIVLNGTITYCHAYRKYTENLRSRDTSLLRTLQMAPIVSAL